jgi:hypothetical protein
MPCRVMMPIASYGSSFWVSQALVQDRERLVKMVSGLDPRLRYTIGHAYGLEYVEKGAVILKHTDGRNAAVPRILWKVRGIVSSSERLGIVSRAAWAPNLQVYLRDGVVESLDFQVIGLEEVMTHQVFIRCGECFVATPKLLAQPIQGQHVSTGARVYHSASPQQRTFSIVAELHIDNGHNSLVRDTLKLCPTEQQAIIAALESRPPTATKVGQTGLTMTHVSNSLQSTVS